MTYTPRTCTAFEWRKSLAGARARRVGAKDRINKAIKEYMHKTEVELLAEQQRLEQEFINSMASHCHCDGHYRPCDGVLAGGLCDGIHQEDYEVAQDVDEMDTP